MDYQVSARKWRPQTFGEVVGQRHVATSLTNAIRLKKVAHAYLFSGSRGTGKTSVARILAKQLGVTDKEVDKLCDAVVRALSKGPLEPSQIREATGNASRSLGEDGKKKGITTTLPLAL